jgi:hypothetical protein
MIRQRPFANEIQDFARAGATTCHNYVDFSSYQLYSLQRYRPTRDGAPYWVRCPRGEPAWRRVAGDLKAGELVNNKENTSAAAAGNAMSLGERK